MQPGSVEYLVQTIHALNLARDLALSMRDGEKPEVRAAWDRIARAQLRLKDVLQRRLVTSFPEAVQLVPDPDAGPDIVGIKLVEPVLGYTDAAHAPAEIFPASAVKAFQNA